MFKKKKKESELHQKVIEALQKIYDPEIPVNIYELGLIYSVKINEDNEAYIEMTLTTPGCPVAQTFPGLVEAEVKCVEGINNATVELVWEPPWTKERMTEEARLTLGLFD